MNWNILEKISEQPFSIIYKVKHKDTGEIAAFKEIKQNFLNKIEKRRFKRSFISISKISHINCVKMIEHIETENSLGYIMEYVEGHDLSSIKRINNGSEFYALVPLILQICNGLNALHSINLIHRDIKPSNILISKSNIAKISDFDLIKVFDNLEVTEPGTFFGTIKYSSPEQCINASKIDLRSDLYSLGIIIYELITGEVPFKGRSYSKIILGHLRESLISPKKLVPDLSDKVEKIVFKLLEKNPEKRYNSANELIKDLKTIPLKNNISVKFEKNKDFVVPSVFIGRQEELKILKECYKNISDSKISFIRGEAGIGKTKLWEQFKIYLEMEQIPIIDIRCKENGLIYKPLKDLILKILDKFKNISTLELMKIMGKFSWDIVEIVPELKEFEFIKKIEKVQPLCDKEKEIRLFDSITNVLRNYINISHSEIVIYFDNLHLADETIKRWISYAMRNISWKNVYFICSYTDDRKKLSNIVENFQENHLNSIINLNPFSEEEISKMITSIFIAKVDTEIIEEIKLITKGNPFFIKELLNYLVRNNKINYQNDVLKIDQKDISHFRSYTLETTINNKLSQLPSEVVELLQIAAIIGENFNINLLKCIFNYEETVILNFLDESRSLNLIDYCEDIDIYKFHHSLIRKILLNKIDIKKKQKFHKLVANEIEKLMFCNKSLYNLYETVEVLAEHYYSAGNFSKAYKYCSKAAINSASKYSNEKAIELYEKVLEIIRGRDKTFLEIRYLIKQGKIYHHIGMWDKAEENYKIAIYLSRKINNKKLTAELNSLSGELLISKGQYNEAIECFQEDLKISEIIKDNYGISRAYENIGKVNFSLSNYPEAIDKFEKSMEIIKKFNDKKRISSIYNNIGCVLFSSGSHNKALQFYKKSLSVAEDIDEKFIISRSLGNMGGIYLNQGRYDKALKYIQKKLDISKKIGFKQGIATAFGNFGNIYSDKNEYEKAIVSFKEKLKISRELGDKQEVSHSIGNMGIVYRKLGNYKKAMECYREVLKIHEELKNKKGLALTYLNIGVLFEKQHQFDEAIKFYEKSLEISREIKVNNIICNALSNIGIIYEFYCNFDKAIEYYEKARELCELNNYYSELIFIFHNKAQVFKVQKKYQKSLKCYEETEKIVKKQNKENLLSSSLLDKAEYLLELENFIEAKKIIEKGKFEAEGETFRAEVILERINYSISQNQQLISELVTKFKSCKNKNEKAYLNYSLWKMMSGNGISNENAYSYSKKALKDYKELFKNEVDLEYSRKIFELEEYLKDKHQLSYRMKNEYTTLISTLVRFLNSKTAFNELLKYLILNAYADNALLLIKKNSETSEKEGDIDRLELDKFEVKAYSSSFTTEDINFSKNILKKVISNQEPIIISNAVEESDLKNNPSIVGKLFLSVLSIPLKNEQGKIIGALYLDRRDIIKEPFNIDNISIVKEIANILTPILIEHEEKEKIKISSEINKLGLFIGLSKKMQELYNKIEKAAAMDMTVLIHGETGTGKELVAMAIHKLSNRRDKPFVAVNCSAIPKTLAESELFGHERGSFSGAIATQFGKFELAHGGILFLDEIADLHLELQAKLLRVLQDNKIWRIGGKKELPVDVRIISSSHKKLEDEVKKGLFREDLYQRLNILDLSVPPLRERKEDIPLLAYHFLKILCIEYNRKVSGFTNDAIINLQSYNWTGNVRELENYIIKAFVKHSDENPINSEDLFQESKIPHRELVLESYILENQSLFDLLDSIEKKVVKKYLENNNWNISATARQLKINRTRLYRIIKKYKFVQRLR